MPSYVQFDVWQNTAGVTRTAVLQTKVTYSDTKSSWSANSTWVEPSTDYRVTITPTFTTSLIVVNYYIPMNIYWTGASNCEHMVRCIRNVGGVRSFPSSAGGTLGSRNTIAGHTYRPPGYDYNDCQTENLTVVDVPATLSAVTYSIEFLQENSNVPTNYMGYTASDNSSWGFSSRMIIVAQEIAQ